VAKFDPRRGERPERVQITVAELLGQRPRAPAGRRARHHASPPARVSPRRMAAMAAASVVAAGSVVAAAVFGSTLRIGPGPGVPTGANEPGSESPGGHIGELAPPGQPRQPGQLGQPGQPGQPGPPEVSPYPGDHNLLMIPPSGAVIVPVAPNRDDPGRPRVGRAALNRDARPERGATSAPSPRQARMEPAGSGTGVGGDVGRRLGDTVGPVRLVQATLVAATTLPRTGADAVAELARIPDESRDEHSAVSVSPGLTDRLVPGAR
jgi:hypothetical protein